ncbi:hypothetical protein FRB94_008309 [Tulasnella sp. JGI-2019a]|nr:hypothetical protein FRB93_007003 [Tulasnella sp. JGI-2019a]KAG9011478.1 hypothetical protein FRB94_008309 [Tulasnella sp. JGI-2019a]
MQDGSEPQDRDALIIKWTAEQRTLARRLIFKDHDLSFSVVRLLSDAVPDDGEDYDTPDVRVEDPSHIQVDGLRYVGGLDISFVEDTGEGQDADEKTGDSKHERDREGQESRSTKEPDAFATVVVLEYPSLKVLHQITQPIHLTVPYIPSFLAYRELPAYLSLLTSLRAKLQEEDKSGDFPQVLLVDGNGRLHAREAGSACAVGWEAGIPTFGVAKNYQPMHSWDHITPKDKTGTSGHWRDTQNGMRRIAQEQLTKPGSWFGLFGNRTESDVVTKAAYIGAAVAPPGKAKNPIFVSTGHKISLVTVIRLTLMLSRTRIPEPVRLADQISRQAVRDMAKGRGKAG